MKNDNKTNPQKEDDFKETPLEKIRAKVLAYHKKMNAIADYLKTHEAPPDIQIDTTKEFMEFYIDKDDLIELSRIAMLENCERLVVFFGLAQGNNSITGCFLGIDKNYEILSQHRTTSNLKDGGGGTVPGQDTWIPPGNGKAANAQDFTLGTDSTIIEYHLRG